MEFIAGIVVGAAFSPFWMKVWAFVKAWVQDFIAKKDGTE